MKKSRSMIRAAVVPVVLFLAVTPARALGGDFETAVMQAVIE